MIQNSGPVLFACPLASQNANYCDLGKALGERLDLPWDEIHIENRAAEPVYLINMTFLHECEENGLWRRKYCNPAQTSMSRINSRADVIL